MALLYRDLKNAALELLERTNKCSVFWPGECSNSVLHNISSNKVDRLTRRTPWDRNAGDQDWLFSERCPERRHHAYMQWGDHNEGTDDPVLSREVPIRKNKIHPANHADRANTRSQAKTSLYTGQKYT